jgi:hypothetical protein
MVYPQALHMNINRLKASAVTAGNLEACLCPCICMCISLWNRSLVRED